jgi:hypothetical protein
MRNIRLKLVHAFAFLSLTMLTMQDGEAANIADGTTLFVPPDPGASVFTTPAPLAAALFTLTQGA